MRIRPGRQRGLTLVELMISLTLGLVLLAGVGTLFVYTNRNNRQNDQLARMQDQARYALATLSRDIQMAGYWGGMSQAEAIVPDLSLGSPPSTTASSALTPALDCGPDATTSWALRLVNRLTTTSGGVSQTQVWSNRLEFRNQSSGTAVTALWRCIGGYRDGTDIVALRRMAGQQTGSMSTSDTQVTLRPYHFYLQTNGVVGTLIRWGANASAAPSGADPLSAPMSFHRFLPRIYYVRDYTRTSGDRLPALCRKELCPSGYTGSGESASCGSGSAAATGFYTECLAEGIEDLQLVWGLDTNADGVVDRYSSTPSAIDVASNALTAQLSVRVRASEPDPYYSDDKTYRLGDADDYVPATASDPAGTPEAQKARHFYRRVYSTTVFLRNPS